MQPFLPLLFLAVHVLPPSVLSLPGLPASSPKSSSLDESEGTRSTSSEDPTFRPTGALVGPHPKKHRSAAPSASAHFGASSEGAARGQQLSAEQQDVQRKTRNRFGPLARERGGFSFGLVNAWKTVLKVREAEQAAETERDPLMRHTYKMHRLFVQRKRAALAQADWRRAQRELGVLHEEEPGVAAAAPARSATGRKVHVLKAGPAGNVARGQSPHAPLNNMRLTAIPFHAADGEAVNRQYLPWRDVANMYKAGQMSLLAEEDFHRRHEKHVAELGPLNPHIVKQLYSLGAPLPGAPRLHLTASWKRVPRTGGRVERKRRPPAKLEDSLRRAGIEPTSPKPAASSGAAGHGPLDVLARAAHRFEASETSNSPASRVATAQGLSPFGRAPPHNANGGVQSPTEIHNAGHGPLDMLALAAATGAGSLGNSPQQSPMMVHLPIRKRPRPI